MIIANTTAGIPEFVQNMIAFQLQLFLPLFAFLLGLWVLKKIIFN